MWITSRESGLDELLLNSGCFPFGNEVNIKDHEYNYWTHNDIDSYTAHNELQVCTNPSVSHVQVTCRAYQQRDLLCLAGEEPRAPVSPVPSFPSHASELQVPGGKKFDSCCNAMSVNIQVT